MIHRQTNDVILFQKKKSTDEQIGEWKLCVACKWQLDYQVVDSE